MPKGLAFALAGLVFVVAAVGFFVGYLGALDEPPPAVAADPPVAELPGAATYLGTVETTGNDLVIVDSEGRRHTYDSAAVAITATESATFDVLEPGDLVIIAVERDAFGGPAIRYIVRRPAGGSVANP